VTNDTRAISPDPTPVAPTHPTRRKRRRFLLVAAGAILLMAGGTAALAARDGLRASRDVHAGRAAFRSLVHDGLSGTSSLQAESAKGSARFEAADARARGSRWIRGWSHVPFLGQPARWLMGATAATSNLGREAAQVIAQIEPRLNGAHEPSQRLRFLDTLAAEFARLRSVVDAVHIPATGWFLPPVNSADRELRGELARLRSAIDDGAVASAGLKSFLAGPSTYLVLAGNNAEMRAGGMVLQAGVLRAENGHLASGDFYSAAELYLEKPVPVPKELDKLYGWLSPGVEWRNVGSSPDFPVTGPMYAAMAKRSKLGAVDGAIQLDVPGVRALLGVVGPVEIGGRHYDASNVERLILHDLYVEFKADQVPRRHEFSALAQGIFKALTDRTWDPRALIKALGEAGAGRHLMLWSSRQAEEAAWSRLGVDGSLDRNGVMVTIQNHTGNKLDWFLRASVDLSVENLSASYRRARMTIQIKNPTVSRAPSYIAGTGDLVPVGGYRALVAVYLPGWATNIQMPGNKVVIAGPDGPMRVVGARVDILRQSAKMVTVLFDIPITVRSIELLPSGRFPAMLLRFKERLYNDGARRSIQL
jgi:hypothetical protein